MIHDIHLLMVHVVGTYICSCSFSPYFSFSMRPTSQKSTSRIGPTQTFTTYVSQDARRSEISHPVRRRSSSATSLGGPKSLYARNQGPKGVAMSAAISSGGRPMRQTLPRRPNGQISMMITANLSWETDRFKGEKMLCQWKRPVVHQSMGTDRSSSGTRTAPIKRSSKFRARTVPTARRVWICGSQ